MSFDEFNRLKEEDPNKYFGYLNKTAEDLKEKNKLKWSNKKIEIWNSKIEEISNLIKNSELFEFRYNGYQSKGLSNRVQFIIEQPFEYLEVKNLLVRIPLKLIADDGKVLGKDDFLYDLFSISDLDEKNYRYDNISEFRKDYENGKMVVTKEIFEFIIKIVTRSNQLFIEFKNQINEYNQQFSKNKKSIIDQINSDLDGQVVLVDGESFNKLLIKNQKEIIEIDKSYIQKFVKISIYLKVKKVNTQNIFESIKNTKNEEELNELVNLLKNQIHTYELLVFHSINMITSLVESELITFYEIYESFDQLGVFNSNWENEISNKLYNIGNGLKDLMYLIYQMENKIVNSIDNLTYITEDSFKVLNNSVNKQLSSIDSSINFNNLLTGIQTYQMYKINQNTKRIG